MEDFAKPKELKTGLRLRTVLMDKRTEELYEIIEVTSTYFIIESLEEFFFAIPNALVCSYSDLKGYTLGGKV
jgi:hypothetical protein